LRRGDGKSTWILFLEWFLAYSFQQSLGVADIASNCTETINSHLSSLQKGVVSLVEEGTREDMPTGSTPRKRNWQYVDHWDLTKSREELLRTRRREGKGIQSSIDEETADEEDSSTADMEDEAVTASLHSSTSSSETLASAPPLPRQLSNPTVKKLSNLPQIPLADTRNTYTTRASRRR